MKIGIIALSYSDYRDYIEHLARLDPTLRPSNFTFITSENSILGCRFSKIERTQRAWERKDFSDIMQLAELCLVPTPPTLPSE